LDNAESIIHHGPLFWLVRVTIKVDMNGAEGTSSSKTASHIILIGVDENLNSEKSQAAHQVMPGGDDKQLL
jgi:hypothetical protein